MTEHLITRRDALRAGAVGIGAARLAAYGSLFDLLVPAGSSAAGAGQRWGAPELVTTVPQDGAWFVSQIAVADFNGDGHRDILITRNSMDAQHSYPVGVLLGDGKGNFTDATSSIFQGAVPQTQFARQIVIADFNGDGRPDVFIADHGDDHSPWPGYQSTLILSAPGGKLVDATANLPQQYAMTHSAAAADVDGNGTIDIYEGNVYGANMVPPRILLNDGTGHFRIGAGLLPAAQSDLNQTQYTGSTFADVNGDGHPDLVLSGQNGSQSAVLLNDGTGHFILLPNALPLKPFGPTATGLGPISFDINGDGHPDLLIGYTTPSSVGRWIQVLINNGDGTFGDQTSTYLPQSANTDSWPVFFRLADLQRTGKLDFGVVTAGMGDKTPLLYLRDQNGNFEPGPAIGAGVTTSFAFLTMWSFIDAAGDGSNDIIGVTNNGDVWLVPELRAAATPPAPPVLSRLMLTPAAFRAARRGASVARAATGTTISYSVSEASTTTFTVDHVRRGNPIPLHGQFTHQDVPGTNRFHFTGRIGGRALTPGKYRLNATPKSATGHVGQTKQTPFRIVG
jgi:hypothetical protein